MFQAFEEGEIKGEKKGYRQALEDVVHIIAEAQNDSQLVDKYEFYCEGFGPHGAASASKQSLLEFISSNITGEKD